MASVHPPKARPHRVVFDRDHPLGIKVGEDKG